MSDWGGGAASGVTRTNDNVPRLLQGGFVGGIFNRLCEKPQTVTVPVAECTHRRRLWKESDGGGGGGNGGHLRFHISPPPPPTTSPYRFLY